MCACQSEITHTSTVLSLLYWSHSPERDHPHTVHRLYCCPPFWSEIHPACPSQTRQGGRDGKKNSVPNEHIYGSFGAFYREAKLQIRSRVRSVAFIIEFDGSNLDQSNRNGPDLKICPRSVAVSSEQLCYFFDIDSGPYCNGRRYLAPLNDYL
ncbi:hypothetical protein EVAR_3234_1 [Eumeta japonica]|uniref:Uncharacterized protein n=1 Tax=Eumeta variegata TaxID=151549 RepID=A0A4C1SUP7_EUMVA|nr:hypothetical protein EVAR_3234_1 [Eumeta japonica]